MSRKTQKKPGRKAEKDKSRKDSGTTAVTGERRGKAKAKAAYAADQVLKTQKEAAKYAGKTERTIRNWVRAGMPKTEDGRYIKAMLDFYKNNEGNQPTEAKKKGQAADAEYKDTRAKLMQMELELKQGKLGYIDDFMEGEVKRHVAVNRSLRLLERTIPARFPEKFRRKARAIVREEVNKILDAFAEGRPIMKAEI